MRIALETLLPCDVEIAWRHVRTSHLLASVAEPVLSFRAGVLTPFIWLFAQLFYRHRQSRWRRLVANGFDYAR